MIYSLTNHDRFCDIDNRSVNVQKQIHGLANAGAESFNAKLEFFRATFRRVDDVKFYSLRVTKLYALLAKSTRIVAEPSFDNIRHKV